MSDGTEDTDVAASKSKARFPRISGAPANDSVPTLDTLFSDLDAIFHFDYDPCPLNGLTTVGVPDGLATAWGPTTFVNPPYSDIAQWLAAAVNNLAVYGSRSVVLIPAHVETLYWDKLVTPWASEIWQCVGGLRFEGYKSKFSMPMALVLYGQFDDVLPLQWEENTRIFLGENYWRKSRLPRGTINLWLRCADARRRQAQTGVVK